MHDIPKLPADYRAPPELLAGRTILVTGAGDGIGKALASSLARHGAQVVLVGRTVAKLEAAYDAIVASGGPAPIIHPMDLLGASPDDYTELAEQLAQQCGGLGGLIHNAGLLGTLTSIAGQDLDRWREVMQVNLHAPLLLTRACLGLLQQAPRAHIVFTGSSVGRRGRAYWGAYSVSKFAIEGLMQVLADELAAAGNIMVCSVNPGPVRTAMRARAYPVEDPATLPSPEAIAQRYLYLLSPAAQPLHGQALDAQ